ncbi:ESPR-type extended signal peptide-containing protein [uncultured Megamonas sp.]|uniref:ESPR-type extended signal peptide-containing protein n=1 Tax=uncultured Megamonas sp. TaxID=286140 RepID=UPI002599C517|nr:ESPR-type extended signal peptide-containing protein [uncultured Megamonas sp.]
MNKIYKVIWSKVKNQYVVVSELAHSNGKQSRTSRNSIRSRIAALVVCGAIAAFGVFNTLPNSVYAAESGGIAKESQYIAIAIDGDGTHALNKVERDGYSYYKQKVKINNQTKYYYVREGYDISVVYDKRYDGANDESAYIIDAKKNNQYNASSDQGLLQAYQTTTSKGKITTLTGVNIEDLNTGVYGGASNSPSVDTPSDFGYHIKVNNLGGIYSKDEDGYIKVSDDLDGTASGTKPAGTWGNTNFETYFSYDVKLENDGTYSYTHGNEKVTVPTNKVYSIDGKLGVFTDAKGNLYTGDVYGDNNEILLSAVGEGNKIYSYWGTKVNDPTQTIGNMTVQDYNSDRKKLQDQAAAYHGDDITNIAVGGENNNGTISLNRVGQYNDQTGKYETTDPVPGTITVTSTGGNGGSGAEHDVKIKFSNTKNPDGFSVDAGSKVEAVTGDNGKVSQIKINGVDYTLGTGGTIAGSFNTQTGEISITQDGQRVLTGRVHDWNVVSGGFDPETGKLTLNTQDKYNKNETDKVEIDGVASTTYVDNKDALNVKYDSAEKTSVTLGGANGTQIHNVADGTDTKDAVNLGQLKNNIYDKYLSTATINKENGTLDLTVTNGNGEGQSKTYNLDLKGYIGELDDYVDEVKISDDKQSLVLKRRNGTEMSVDIADLAGAGLSTSDYHLIGSGEDGTGTYSPDKDGNIELQVKDEKTGTISKVKLEDIASADDVAGNTSSITEINNTLANGVVKYDYDSETKQYKDSVTLKGENGSQIHNLADGTDTKDAVNLGQLSGKTGDLQYNTNHYVTNDEDLTVSIGKLDTQVYQNTTSITKLQGQTIDGGYVEDGVINLTHKNGDNTTKTVAQIDGLEDYTLQNGQFITKAKDENGKFTGATELTIADKYDPTKTEKVTIDGLVTYNTTQKLDETTGETIVTGIDYDNIRLAGENGTRITNLVDGWVDEKSTDAVNGSQLASVKDGAVKYWQNEDGSYDKSFVQLEGGEDGTLVTHVRDGAVNEYSSDAVNGSQLWETQQQIKDVETTANKHTIVSTPEDSNLTVTNIAKNDEAANYQVELKDDITLGEGNNQIRINGSDNNGGKIVVGQGQKTVEIDNNSITLNKSLVIDGSGDHGAIIHGLSNNNWNPAEKDNSTTAATEGQLYDVYDGSVKYWQNQDGTYDKSFIQLEGGEEGTTITHLRDGVVAEHSTEAINGSQLWETQQQIKDVETTANKHTIVSTPEDSNLTVTNIAKNDEAANYQVALKDDITLKGDDSSIELNGTKGTIQVNQETAEGTDFTNINGNVVSIGYTNSEGTQNAIVIDGGKGTITGLSNTTWDDELAKQVANSEELQGTAATQGQLQQAVSEVAEVANAGWNAKAGGNTINVKPNETLNFEGDGNITVSATGGTSNELKFGLNDNITLGDKESTSITLYTDPTSETTVVGTDGNTTNVTGYVPESYKSGTGADFVKNNGGFALFTTDTQGHGIFGVTTKGTAHGKDFVTYTKDIYGNDTRYSLNDVGDAVAQMSSYYNEENRKSYTVFSRYLNEAEKDNPFVTVDEDGNKINATRDIPLALRDDGAVLIGATIKGEDFTDNGIRINAETETTYDEDGNEVTNNIATITGLENTEWTPPAPVATFANEGTETSRAATEAQLNDLYGTVVGYNVDTDGVNYGTVTLGGGRTSYDKDTHEGGTVLNNVAYASGTDGSEAVNVDYLNDAINNAVKDGGAISDSDRHLQEGTYHVNDQGEVELIVADEKGENRSTVTIDNIANKNDITNLDNKIDNTFNDLNDKINNIDNVETDVKGGNINEDGTISLKTENEDGTTTNVTLKGQLTDSGVVQEGTTFDKETGTLTITSQDKYSGKTSSVTVDGIASTDVVGVTTKEELADKYKAADEDGNATTAYITESESMVEADVALDHAIQDVAGTSYANDMVLSNRIDSVEKRLGNVEERIDKVGAMAAAIANLRTMGFDPEAPTEIAIGVGQYKSETGIAIGVFHYPNQDFMLSASLSSSGDELMGGIGATWKLGRKSAAERAKDEEARHLEQAEEMKKLAQQEKVKAQAQRHAKLLAERQQASQKNA